MLLAMALALSGCASLGLAPAGLSPALPLASSPTLTATGNPEVSRCSAWLLALDAAVDKAHVRDGAAHPVAGFGWLRVDRFLASFREDLLAGLEGDASSARFADWLTHLEAMDAQGRAVELANLPDDAVPDGLAKSEAEARTQACSALLSAAVAKSPELRQQLIDRAQVPDDYQPWKRTLGLYPLTRLPFFAGVQGWQKGLQARFDASGATAASATTSASAVTEAPGRPLDRYLPRTLVQQPGPTVDTGALLGAAPRDALGIWQLDDAQKQQLLDAYAPVLEIETQGQFDRFGRLRWGTGLAPEVLTDTPLAYRRLAWTRYGAQVLPQLVYSFWFPERPSAGVLDLLAGTLDAVVLRVTLSPEGAPLMVDSIHACGCYHLFFPVGAVTPRPAPSPSEEWAFVPATLPALLPGQRVAVQLESGTHYLVGIRPDAGEPGQAYAMEPDDTLRTLPVGMVGGTRSAFLPSGIVPGTERGERWLFWPMGIDSPGSMRQWGRQPTAFVGRRHFDDARLLEQRFDLFKR